MQGKFRVILRNWFNIIATMSVQNTTFPANFLPNVRFDGLILSLGDEANKKSVGLRSRGRCRVNAELSFEIGSTLSLQWLCKIPLSQLTLFQLGYFMTGRFPLEMLKKKSVEALNRIQCRAEKKIVLKISLQWLWKLPFSQLTSFFWLLNMFVWESEMYLYIREVMTRQTTACVQNIRSGTCTFLLREAENKICTGYNQSYY